MKKYFKKFLVPFVSVILIFVLSFSCSAASVETVPFLDRFRIGVTDIYGWTVGTDYTRSASNTVDDISSDVYATASTELVKPLRSWLTNFICYDFGEDGSSSISSLLYDEFLSFNLRFTVEGLFHDEDLSSDGSLSTLDIARVYIVNPDYKNSLWNLGNHYYAGSVDFEGIKDYKANFTANVSFHNKNQDIEELRFFIVFRASRDLWLDYNYQTFSNYAYNFYKGSYAGAPADVPKYDDPDSSIGSDVDGFVSEEQEILDGTLQGRNELDSYFNNFGDSISQFITPISSITEAVNYFVNGSVLQSIISISLVLGCFFIIFGVGSSVRSSSIRSSDRSDYRRGR